MGDSSEIVFEVNTERQYGSIIGSCKWFNKKVGYGFITIYNGEHKGSNIFVHHTGIQPLNSHFKTLKKGEYISLDIVQGTNGNQAVNVKGVCGGPLMCDHIETPKKHDM
jgi:cold shock CspA family protein